MGDIIIPKRKFGSFMMGVTAAFISLFVLGGVFATTVYYTGSGNAIDAGTGTVTNLGTPSDSADIATKGYVDAASGVNVYKSDGSTLLGKYVGYYTTSSSTADLSCDNIIYANSTNETVIIGSGNCQDDPASATWYYSTSDCTGTISYGHSFICPGSGTITTNYGEVGVSGGTCTVHNNYYGRNPSTGACTSVADGYYYNQITTFTRTCGTTGKCQIK